MDLNRLFTKAPQELFLHCLSFCSAKELSIMRLVSSSFLDVIENPSFLRHHVNFRPYRMFYQVSVLFSFEQLGIYCILCLSQASDFNELIAQVAMLKDLALLSKSHLENSLVEKAAAALNQNAIEIMVMRYDVHFTNLDCAPTFERWANLGISLGSAFCLARMSLLRLQQARYDESLECLEKCVENGTDSGGLRIFASLLLCDELYMPLQLCKKRLRQVNTPLAIELLKKSVEINETNASIYMLAEACRLGAPDFPQNLEEAKKYLELGAHFHDPRCTLELGLLLFRELGQAGGMEALGSGGVFVEIARRMLKEEETSSTFSSGFNIQIVHPPAQTVAAQEFAASRTAASSSSEAAEDIRTTQNGNVARSENRGRWSELDSDSDSESDSSDEDVEPLAAVPAVAPGEAPMLERATLLDLWSNFFNVLNPQLRTEITEKADRWMKDHPRKLTKVQQEAKRCDLYQ